MPVYSVKLTVPVGGIEESTAEATVEVEGAVLTKVYIQIPPGHQALTGLRIMYGDKAIVPWNEGEWIRGDGIFLALSPNWWLPESPCILTIKGTNQDVKYSHSFYIVLETQPEEFVPNIGKLSSLFHGFLKRIGLG